MSRLSQNSAGSPARRFRLVASLTIGALVIAIIAACGSDALAQAKNPFNVGISEGGSKPPQDGIVGWIFAQQIAFERMLSGAVRAIKTETQAIWALLGISFAYGVFHAAGPGHGKAVVASYMLANERALKRGVIISFLAALLQGFVAIALVGVLAWLLNATAQRMRTVANLVEVVSFAGIALLGLWLVWRKGAGLIAALRESSPPPPHAHDHDHDHDHGAHQHGAHAHDHRAHGHGHSHDQHADRHHVHDEHCGHFHAPDPKTLGENFAWGPALATVVTAGARPCSGAILVLVFALAQGIFLAGVAATFAMALGTALTTGALAAVAVLAKGLAIRFTGEGGRRGVLFVRAFECVAALAVFLLGATLFTGALRLV